MACAASYGAAKRNASRGESQEFSGLAFDGRGVLRIPVWRTDHVLQTGRRPHREGVVMAKPVHEVRIGRVRAAVWANETTNGVAHSVTFSRLYKDEESGK